MRDFVRPFDQQREVQHEIPNCNVGDCGLPRCERLGGLFPSSKQGPSDRTDRVRFSCPVAIVGSHYHVSLYSALAANVATYALVGLAVEILWRQLNHSN
jgi:hypothetical protein